MTRSISNRAKTIFKALLRNLFVFKRVNTIGSHKFLSRNKICYSLFIIKSLKIIKLMMFAMPLRVRNYLDKLIINSVEKMMLLRHPNVISGLSLSGKHSLRVCITYNCNRNCSFCYSDGLQKEFKQDMSIKDFEFLALWAKSQGFNSFRLLGGEPTIHPEFKKILDISKKQGLSLSLSTNGLYDPQLNLSFDKSVIESINFSYPQDQLKSDELILFKNNLKEVISKYIPLVLSGVIYPDRQDWRLVIDLAKKFRTKVVTRFSMVLPGHNKHFSTEEFKSYSRGLAKQIIDIARYAYKHYVVFYFYRPLLLCMFNKEEMEFLRSISPFL
ncbi:MAG: radical SAM protein, partial [Candidatus Omnitrophica bacterium]|nr:radical SAM protein [Candidatus Omnitrophota bacterium]MBU1923016.1 radical SAM protein [Candidatus Omnitrophota bacterium]